MREYISVVLSQPGFGPVLSRLWKLLQTPKLWISSAVYKQKYSLLFPFRSRELIFSSLGKKGKFSRSKLKFHGGRRHFITLWVVANVPTIKKPKYRLWVCVSQSSFSYFFLLGHSLSILLPRDLGVFLTHITVDKWYNVNVFNKINSVKTVPLGM